MAKRNQKIQQPELNVGVCRDCALVTYVTKWETLSLKGEPTLGTCPYQDVKVLLSLRGCPHWKEKDSVNKE